MEDALFNLSLSWDRLPACQSEMAVKEGRPTIWDFGAMKTAIASSASHLAAQWGRWTKIVRGFALRRPRREMLDSSGYQTLRSGILALAQQQTAENDPANRQVIEELSELVAPWVTIESLARAQHHLVQEVLERAEAVQCRLDGRTPKRCRALCTRRVLAPVAAIAVPVLLVTLRGLASTVAPANEVLQEIWWLTVQRWMIAGANFLNRCGPCEFAVILGLGEAAVLAPMLWFWRSN